ncbi:hypothetical protein BHE16_03475 [Neomicrococcus aestuarii]|uniref:Copper chaperone PCu(A)C n=2 Tax=Neomicrococcus aestuarii TaxID=556325 RepID=A0A1L2ZRG9_9MICC|nr:hypothetical protein BHE16_03475 [Neomicrococcus aestuarii]
MALALSGCSAGSGGTNTQPASNASTSSSSSTSSTAAARLSVKDPWIKAVSSGMTAGFGIISNTTDQPLQVVAASSEVAAEIQLHETTAGSGGTMTMREVDGGFTIPAQGDLVLAPGANHLMFMGVKSALNAGDDITITLTFADGSTFTYTAPVKDFAGANENYEH